MMTDPYIEKLIAFHDKYEHTNNGSPAIPSVLDRELRIRLILEEVEELILAMKEGNIVKIAKEMADVLYVVFGTALTYGIPIQLVFGAVHVSNMTKPMKKDKGGKTVKNEEYIPPDVRAILERAQPRTSA